MVYTFSSSESLSSSESSSLLSSLDFALGTEPFFTGLAAGLTSSYIFTHTKFNFHSRNVKFSCIIKHGQVWTSSSDEESSLSEESFLETFLTAAAAGFFGAGSSCKINKYKSQLIFSCIIYMLSDNQLLLTSESLSSESDSSEELSFLGFLTAAATLGCGFFTTT